MKKFALLGLIGTVLLLQVSAQEAEIPLQEVSVFAFMRNVAQNQSLLVSARSNETINNRRVNGDKSFITNIESLVETDPAAAVPTVPTVSSTVYDPALPWGVIVFITFMAIMLFLVGIMMALREVVFKKNTHPIVDEGYQSQNRVEE